LKQVPYLETCTPETDISLLFQWACLAIIGR